MKNILLLLLFAVLSTLTAQDSLYCSIKYTPFKEFVGNVKAGGDLNGDGYKDLVIARIGQVNIYFGKAVMNNIPDIVINNPDTAPANTGTYSGFGEAIAYNGDLNGDGYSDLVISAPYFNTNNAYKDGRVYIYFGKANFDGVADRVISGRELGVDEWDLEFGKGLEICGDYNNDGFDDLAVYSQGASYFFYGHVHIFNGSADFDTTPDWNKDGQPRDMVGQSLTAGDVNGDGYDDLALIIGVLDDPKTIELYAGGNTMSQQSVWSYGFEGEQTFEFPGNYRLNANGDFNGDGKNDIVFIRNLEDMTDTSTVWARTIIFKGANDFQLSSNNYSNSKEIKSISVGCLNNDNVSDIIVAFCWKDYFDAKGTVNCYYGSTNFDFNYSIEVSGLDSLYCFGTTNYLLGDINKDGFSDIAFGTNKIPYNIANQNWLGIYSLNKDNGIDDHETQIKSFNLSSYPNPFNNTTKINYNLPAANLVKLAVYNAKGELVKTLINARQVKGLHSADFNATGLNSGVYYLRLIAGEVNQTQKIVLVK